MNNFTRQQMSASFILKKTLDLHWILVDLHRKNDILKTSISNQNPMVIQCRTPTIFWNCLLRYYLLSRSKIQKFYECRTLTRGFFIALEEIQILHMLLFYNLNCSTVTLVFYLPDRILELVQQPCDVQILPRAVLTPKFKLHWLTVST